MQSEKYSVRIVKPRREGGDWTVVKTTTDERGATVDYIGKGNTARAALVAALVKQASKLPEGDRKEAIKKQVGDRL